MSGLDFRTAHHVAAELIAHGLRAIYTDEIEHHGDWFRATHARVPHKAGSIDGLVTFTVEDQSHDGPAALVTVMVSATPIVPRP